MPHKKAANSRADLGSLGRRLSKGTPTADLLNRVHEWTRQVLEREMEECRQAIAVAGRGSFENLESEVCDLPPLAREQTLSRQAGDNQRAAAELKALDWRDVYMTIRSGVMMRAGFHNLPPEWCRDRDGALGRVEKALKELHRVCKRHPTASELLLTYIEPLEREYRGLREAPAQPRTLQEGQYDWNANTRWRLLNATHLRKRRPTATWRHETHDALTKVIKVTVEAAEGLLEVAGLVEKTPNQRNEKSAKVSE